MVTKDSQFTLVGLGELLWDLLPTGRQLGGAPANFAFHAQALGEEGKVVSCVGTDDLGHEAIELLQQLELDSSYVAFDDVHPTGTVTVQLHTNGTPCYKIHEGVAWDYMSWCDELAELAPSCDAVCFGTLAQRNHATRQSIRRFLESTRPECLRVFDINLRQSYFDASCIHESLELANVLKVNDEELPVAARLLQVGAGESEFLAEVANRYSLHLIAVTKGASGSRLFTSDYDGEQQPEPMEVVDTVGAGDSFAAAMTVGLLRGCDMDMIHRTANRLASYVCTQAGAMPVLGIELGFL